MTSGSNAVAAVRQPARLAAFVALTKPRITLLLLVACVSTMIVAAQGVPPLSLVALTALGLALSSSGASALNHVLDRDIDALMVRTAQRPIVTGVIAPREGAVFGVLLIAASVAVLWTQVNPVAALLALSGALFYAVVYTMVLKRLTPQNIVIGGAAGAVPPLVGWAAVTGSVSATALLLFLVIFLWTPPHFWALALLMRDDYERAGVPMLPVVAGSAETSRQITLYTLLLVAATAIPLLTSGFGVVYAVAAGLLGIRLTWHALQLNRATRYRRDELAAARKMFLFSMSYLALLFLAIVVDQSALHIPLG